MLSKNENNNSAKESARLSKTGKNGYAWTLSLNCGNGPLRQLYIFKYKLKEKLIGYACW